MLDILFLATVVFAQCASIQTPTEWRTLTAEEQINYLTALKCLREEKKSRLVAQDLHQPTTRWDDFSYVYYKSFVAENVLKKPAFLPWHRAFLALFENELRKGCNYRGRMPYWDWTRDASAPLNSRIWNSFGKEFGFGDGKNQCITTPIVGRWDTTYVVPHCVTRKAIDLGGGTEFTLKKVQEAIFKAQDYGSLRKSLEMFRDRLLQTFGGDLANVPIAPNDPLFYLIFGNINRLWAFAQAKNQNVNIYGGTIQGDKKASDTNVLQFYGLFSRPITVKEVLNTKSGFVNGLMCYDYGFDVTSTLAPPRPALPPASSQPTTQTTRNLLQRVRRWRTF